MEKNYPDARPKCGIAQPWSHLYNDHRRCIGPCHLCCITYYKSDNIGADMTRFGTPAHDTNTVHITGILELV